MSNWTIKELKVRGRQTVKHNYWRIVGVILIASFIVGGLHLDLNIGSGITAYKEAHQEITSIASGGGSRFGDQSSVQIIDNFISQSETNGDLFAIAEKYYSPSAGIIAEFYNQSMGAKSFLLGTLNGINKIAFSDRIGQGIIVLIGAVIMLLLWIFVGTQVIVGRNRFMLESTNYRDTPINRILFTWRMKEAKNVALTMVLRQIYLALWSLTIVGGVIKYYSYRMVPYILAENPSIKPKDAIKMSIDMMRGQKWHTFLLDMSFVGWYILDVLTFGILEWLWIWPYKDGAFAGLYFELRAEAKERQIANADLLFDTHLDVPIEDANYPYVEYPLDYREVKRVHRLNYRRHYSLISIILLFFTFSIMGWIWEVSLHLVEDGVFVNRGTMHLPWLPIYGAGGVLIILLLKRFADKPGLVFILSMLICGIVEYATATYLWDTKHMLWWEYYGYFLNIKGRICAESVIFFGLGGMGFLYILGPFFDDLYRKIPRKTAGIICVVLLVIFACDAGYSSKHPNTGAGITDYSGLSMQQIDQMEDGQDNWK